MTLYRPETPCSVYIHVPYCHSKCPYCDFNVYAVKEVPEASFVSLILKEWETAKEDAPWKGGRLSSVFFGGGTPSFLSGKALGRILKTIRDDMQEDSVVEFCLEANPQDCTDSFAKTVVEAGFNRVSLGSQSLFSSTLSVLGRKHSPKHVYDAVSNFRAHGLENISIDMMFAAPEQTVSSIEKELELFLELKLPHLSTYQLTIEQGTPFHVAHSSGRLSLPEEEEILSMMNRIHDILSLHGYEQYEISNFALKGFESIHNMGYWTLRSYLGLGPGAHSLLRYSEGGAQQVYERRGNLASPTAYQEALEAGKTAVAWKDTPDLKSQMAEFMMLGLRTRKGVCPKQFSDLFGYTFIQCYEEELQELLDRKLLMQCPEGRYTLTRDGVALADSVTAYFVDPDGVIDR